MKPGMELHSCGSDVSVLFRHTFNKSSLESKSLVQRLIYRWTRLQSCIYNAHALMNECRFYTAGLQSGLFREQSEKFSFIYNTGRRSWSDHGQIMVRSSQITVRSLSYHGQITVRSRSYQGQITVRSRSDHGRITVRSRSDHGQITVRSRSDHGSRKYSFPLFKYFYSYQCLRVRGG